MTILEFLWKEWEEDWRPVFDGKLSADEAIQKIIDGLKPQRDIPIDEEACYSGTSTLANYFSITDEYEVAILSNRFAAIRVAALLKEEAEVPFDFTTLEDIHGLMYGDLFPSAGMVRKTAVFPYCMPSYVEDEAEKAFRLIQAKKYLKLFDAPSTATALTSFLADLVAIHPFLQGNEEAALVLIVRIGSYAGFLFDFSCVNRASLFQALASSVSDPAPLSAVMASMTQRASTSKKFVFSS